jgi:5-oxoprolinase (ATP-hydrolysing)/N-methylhydantoinase A
VNVAGRYQVGIDIGGTFTDFFLIDTETSISRVHKCLTTPHDPAEGALAGFFELLQAAGVGIDQVGVLVHGTTLVANAIIERHGARLVFFTTRGFRDVLEMGTEQRYDIYDLFLRFPEPLVPRNRICEIDERVSRDGDVLVPLDLNQVRREMKRIAALDVTAAAVCFLHAYKNPTHEQQVRDVLHSEFPGLAVTLSSDVVPEVDEYPRATTTAANAYVQPLMARYLGQLESRLRTAGFRGVFYMMQSYGGSASVAMAQTFPVRLMESGPAAGALAAAYFGQRAGYHDVIAFDMGGTTAKASLIQGGRPDVASEVEAARVHRFKRGSGLPIKAPVVELIEIGAGGGSIASIDPTGLLKVGPRSAGADPGPSCYGTGGSDPTVTDADLLLGYLDPNYFLGGRMKLNLGAATTALNKIAEPLGLSTHAAAWGIHNIVNENMAGAARAHIIERGRDPRRYAMVAFGGAGPVHATRVARILGVSEVIVPPSAGAASAVGLLVAPTSFDFATSLPGVLTELNWDEVNHLLDQMAARGREMLTEAGVPRDQVRVTRRADMRLLGQIHDITVSLPNELLTADAIPQIEASFAREYARLYTHVYQGAVIQVINWRIRCTGPQPQLDVRFPDIVGGEGAAGGLVQKGERTAYFPEVGGAVSVPVYDRYRLEAGDQLCGPCIVEERESTTVVGPGDQLRVDAQLNLRVRVQSSTSLEPIVRAGMPLAESIRRIESDPIGLEIMWNRLIGIAEECWLTVWRTAFSLIIGHAQDFGCELMDPRGNSLGHAPRSMPVFNLTLPLAVEEILKRFPADSMQPGDILCTNDPWVCAGHLYDLAIVTPVFRGPRVVALVGTIAHLADIGGTQDSLHAREIYEEGLMIPPMKLCRAGEMNHDLLDLIAANVRKNEQVLGDIHAVVSANASAAERLRDFMEEYGLEDLVALATVIQNRSERATREAVRRLPDGVYEGVARSDGMGHQVELCVRITVRGDQLHATWHDVPRQFEQGGSNCTFSYTRGHTAYPLKCLLTPEVPSNAGCFRPFHISAPSGSVLNCSKPAAVNTRTRTGWYLAPAIFAALAPATPKQVQAFTGLPGLMYVYGQDSRGRFFHDHLLQAGGQGASAHGDGKSSLLWPTSAANTSIELFETRVPVLIVAKEYLPDSGGPGRFRGGLGQLLRIRKLYDDDRSIHVSVLPDCVVSKNPGLLGGEPGAPGAGRLRMFEKGEEVVHDCGIGKLVLVNRTNQIVELQLAGGAGYGNAAERSPESVQRDLDMGYITMAGARKQCG